MNFNIIAPEVFKGKGYAYSVDWWGLGVILFECLYGKVKYSFISYYFFLLLFI